MGNEVRFDTDSSVIRSLLSTITESVVVVDENGTVIFANRAACDLFGYPHAALLGLNIYDLFYTVDLERITPDEMIRLTEVCDHRVMAQSCDGSSVPVRLTHLSVTAQRVSIFIAIRDIQYESLREHKYLVEEVQRLNERLAGTLSIISSASFGEGTFDTVVLHVANELQHVMSADAVEFYLADDYGFTPYGVSEGFDALNIEKSYLPMGIGVPTLVARNQRTTRLQLVSPAEKPESGAIMLDLDNETRFRLRSMLADCCSTIIGTPVFSYDRIVAILIVGWLDPHEERYDDVRLLDTVADFLSVEFAAAVTQIEQRRSSDFADTTDEIRSLIRSEKTMTPTLIDAIAARISHVVPSRIITMESGPYAATALVRLHDEETDTYETLEYPHDITDLFSPSSVFVEIQSDSACGMWFARHTDLTGGFGILLTPADSTEQSRLTALLIMRSAFDRPFDMQDRVFLENLSHDIQLTLHAEQERVHDAEIARALQMGLRNELPPAAGVTTASRYISATESAVVGGDFFDLYNLTDGRIVIVMGDVSGKGVEAASMASLVKTALAAYAWDYLDPASMVSSLNNLFLNFSRLETFASLVVVSLDFNTLQATYCSAGHPPAMVVHRPEEADAELELLTVQSPIVGAFEKLAYVNGTFNFSVNDILYLYTDGTTEARNQDGIFFGEETLRETLLHVARNGVENIPQGILDEVLKFSGGTLHDDISMVAVRFDGLSDSDN